MTRLRKFGPGGWRLSWIMINKQSSGHLSQEISSHGQSVKLIHWSWELGSPSCEFISGVRLKPQIPMRLCLIISLLNAWYQGKQGGSRSLRSGHDIYPFQPNSHFGDLTIHKRNNKKGTLWNSRRKWALPWRNNHPQPIVAIMSRYACQVPTHSYHNDLWFESSIRWTCHTWTQFLS